MKAPSSAPSAPSHRIFHHPVIPAAQASYRPLNLPLRRHGPSDDVEPSPPKKPRPDCSDAQKAAYMNNFSNRGTAAEDGPTKAEAANARHSLLPPPASAAATPSDLSSSSSSSSDLPICAAMDPRKTPGGGGLAAVAVKSRCPARGRKCASDAARPRLGGGAATAEGKETRLPLAEQV